jgi:hypothetical protein
MRTRTTASASSELGWADAERARQVSHEQVAELAGQLEARRVVDDWVHGQRADVLGKLPPRKW